MAALNQFHQHDWPFITAPFIHQHVFNHAEGALDTGIEYSILLPSSFYLDLTVGATNGFTYGHAHNAGEKPKQPTHYAHLKTFATIGSFGFQPGVSFLKRKDANKNEMKLIGFNFTGKIRHGKILRWLIESEFWQRMYTPSATNEKETTFGYYIYPQYGIDSQLSFGLRGDFFTNQNLKTLAGSKVPNHRIAFVPTFTYKASEFSTVRLAYTWEEHKQNKTTTTHNKIVELQTTYILGAHKAHEF